MISTASAVSGVHEAGTVIRRNHLLQVLHSERKEDP